MAKPASTSVVQCDTAWPPSFTAHEHVLEDTRAVAAMSCLKPACGAGHMAKVLKEYFGQVHCSDAYRYGYGHERDFLIYPYEAHAVDWVITNPPFAGGTGP
jgi:hypothetical protein